jgi:hypothetical protein
LDREERIYALIGVLFLLVSLLIQIFEWYGVTPQSLAPYSMIITLIFAIIGIIFLALLARIRSQQKSSKLDPRFRRLHIYFSDSQDSPTSKELHRPYYVVYEVTKQAYYVPELIFPYLRQQKIACTTYPNKTALLNHFKQAGIHPNNIQPPSSDLDLGLWLKPNGSLVVAERRLEPEMLEKLKKLKLEGKFKNYQIAFLNPWYCWFFPCRRVENYAFPPTKRILVKGKEAFGAPEESLDLTRFNKIIPMDKCTPRPYEDITKWCKRKKGWKFESRTFTVEELAGDYQ